MNSWEASALRYQYDGEPGPSADALIYPGIYSATGFDLMGVLAAVFERPSPQIDIGPVDWSCPILVCDLKETDNPIIYASDGFYHLTGYCKSEVVGQNCRFLQDPKGKVKPKSTRKYVDKDTIRAMRKAVDKNDEIQLEVANFKKNGQRFINFLSIVPIPWKNEANRFSVGFLYERDT